MIARLSSPLGSPTLAATAARLGNRLPLQLRRSIPLYIACVVLLLFMLNVNLFRSDDSLLHPEPPSAAPRTPPQSHGIEVGKGVGLGSATYASSGSKKKLPMQQPKVVRRDFPHKIWQTWKVNPLEFERRDSDTAKSWVNRNPDWRYEVLTDGNEMAYVEYHFGPEGFNRPDIVDFYRTIKAAIVKADLLRYIVMYAEGGVYADIDVEALKPMHKFVPERYDHADIDMVVGVEIDEPDWRDHPILGPKSRSFCQWVFMCKPQLPVMMRLIEQIMSWLNQVAHAQGVSVADVNLDFDEIISGTGPSAFTNAIIADMQERLTQLDPKAPEITWDIFHDMGESRIVSRVLVLTVEAFAAGQGHSDSGTHDARAALVRHHYHASNWPSRHPRYSHPVYGEVENCNWNDDCVHKWDENVANFKKLPEEEQQKLIADKERELKEEKEKKEAEERKRKEEEEAKRRREDEERKEREFREWQEKKAREKEEEAKKETEKVMGPEPAPAPEAKGKEKEKEKEKDKPKA